MVSIEQVDFSKCGGLIPCIVQDFDTKDVLMLAYMNKEALELSISTHKATFFSRSRQEIWVKGESHDTYLPIVDIKADCDGDTLLMLVKCNIQYNVCHLGQETCFGKRDFSLEYLSKCIEHYADGTMPSHYTKTLLEKPEKCAQKVGEEATEVVIEAIKHNKERFIYESADLLYHLLTLMETEHVSLNDVVQELKSRHK